jgi:prevent-host-death family protein
MSYNDCVSRVSAQALRNQTHSLLDRVANGEHLTITVSGRPGAELIPPASHPQWMGKDQFLSQVLKTQADSDLATDLAELAGGTTPDLAVDQ